MQEKMRFVTDYAEGLFGLSELSRRYGISRKTAYKWLERMAAEGPGGLVERAPVALRVANRTDERVEALIVAFRRKHPTWGPRKLLWKLSGEEGVVLPSASTVAAILRGRGFRRGGKGGSGRAMGESRGRRR